MNETTTTVDSDNKNHLFYAMFHQVLSENKLQL
jgi:hypothetical protein